MEKENIKNGELPRVIVPIQIKGIEDYYISNYGEVYSGKSRQLKELSQIVPRVKKSSYQYKTVSLYNNESKMKTCYIHRLVALHFIPNPNPNICKCVDHIDGNQSNNMASNLRWCTPKENSNNINSNLTKPIARFSLDGRLIDTEPSKTKYSEKYGYSIANISKCLKGNGDTAYGYTFKYLDKEAYKKGEIIILENKNHERI